MIKSTFSGFALLVAGVLGFQMAAAQPHNVITNSITWTNDNSQREEVFSVPANYTASKKYKLIVGLHGLGGDPGSYMNNAFSQMTSGPTESMSDDCDQNIYNCASPVYDNFIIACPQAIGTNTDFWEPAADTGLITHIIADAMAAYNIDPNYIYLNGFSLGGRAALRYGLYNPTRFRGMFFFVDAIQSMAEALNQSSTFTYAYQNATMIPINSAIASEDGLQFFDVEAYKQVYNAGGIVEMRYLYPYCHDPSPDTYTFNAISFIDNNATSHLTDDAGIYAILSPTSSQCSGTFTPIVTIQNKGAGTLKSATINYQVDGGTVNTFNWTGGNLLQLQRSNVSLPSMSVSSGNHTFVAYTSLPNGVQDNKPSNDQMSLNFSYTSTGTNMVNISIGFEDQTQAITGIFPPDWRTIPGWSQMGTDSAYYWELDTTVGSQGSTTSIHFDNAVMPATGVPTLDNEAGKIYSFISPAYDFSNISSPQLSFDYAYAPILTASGGSYMQDALQVQYTTDCGNTWNTLFNKAGQDLQTYLTGATGGVGLKTNGDWIPPTQSQWVTAPVSLNALVGKQNVRFAFQNVSGTGNFLYLDNITISGTLGVADKSIPVSSFEAFPNPSNGQITVSFSSSEKNDYVLEFRDILGQVLYTQNLNGFSGNYTGQLDVTEFKSGMYFLNLKSKDAEVSRKLLINQ